MAVRVNFNDNCAHNVNMRKEKVLWVGATIHPMDSGIYYVKFINPKGEITKGVAHHEGLKWHIGSGELAGVMVYEWMDDRKKEKNE